MLYQKNHLRQTFFIATLVTIVTLLAIVMISTYADDVAAQEPAGEPTPVPFSEEMLEAFGLSADSIDATAVSFNLIVNKTANVTTIASGGYVTYTITITNSGPDNANIVLFKDNYSTSQMSDVSFYFSQPATSDGHTPPTWLFDGPIPASQTATVTVTGKLEAAIGTIVQNTVEVIAFGETNPNNNTSSASVRIGSGSGGFNVIYLPILHKNPLPEKILVYHETFNSGKPWTEFNSNGCKAYHSGGQYWVDLDNNKECLPPAKNENKPEKPYRTYGEFEVTAYVSGENQEDDHWYGLFINGEGGKNYYRFRIKPNEADCSSGGDWELTRRKNDSNKTLASKSCDANIKRGYGSGAANKLAVRHTAGHQLLVYINDVLIQTVNLTSDDRLSGSATGVYIETKDSNKKIRMKFDDFIVYSLP